MTTRLSINIPTNVEGPLRAIAEKNESTLAAEVRRILCEKFGVPFVQNNSVWSREMVDRLVELHEKGATQKEMAADLGLPASTCRDKIQILRRSGADIPRRRGGPSKKPKTKVESTVWHSPETFDNRVMGTPGPGRSALDGYRQLGPAQPANGRGKEYGDRVRPVTLAPVKI